MITQSKMTDKDMETLYMTVFASDPDWKDELSSRLMELSLQGWWYESSVCTEKEYACGHLIDIRFIRFRNGPITTNIDADLISRIITI